MIYDLSLRTAGIVTGVLLLISGAVALLGSDNVRASLARFPRSKLAGIVLLTLAALWSFWLLVTMEMGEFSTFRKPLMIALPIAYALVLKFVDEFLAVRALGILCLLAGEPLLEAAFLRYEWSRLLVTVFAYVLIVLGLFWVTMPYLLRDQIGWMTRSFGRWKLLGGIAVAYAVTVFVCTFTQY